MVKVFAAVRGAAIRVAEFGVATDTAPVVVPAEVAKELLKLPEFRPETKAPAPTTEKPAKGEEK